MTKEEQIAELEAQLAEARAERDQLREELRRERERLDWVQEHATDIEACERTPGKLQWELVWGERDNVIVGDSLREVIDSAIGGRPDQPDVEKAAVSPKGSG